MRYKTTLLLLLRFSCSFFHFNSNFLHFLPHFGISGGKLAHLGRPWLSHCNYTILRSLLCALKLSKHVPYFNFTLLTLWGSLWYCRSWNRTSACSNVVQHASMSLSSTWLQYLHKQHIRLHTEWSAEHICTQYFEQHWIGESRARA